MSFRRRRKAASRRGISLAAAFVACIGVTVTSVAAAAQPVVSPVAQQRGDSSRQRNDSSQRQSAASRKRSAAVTDAGDPLVRRIAMDLDDIPLEAALRRIARDGALRLSYSSDIVPLDRRVTLVRERTTIGDALREILRGTDLDVVVTPAGHVVLVRAPVVRPISSTQIAGAEPWIAAPEIAIRASARAQLIDRVLVMGTPFGGAPERHLTTAVTVLTADQIAQRGQSNMEELFRSGIPGVVAWNLGAAGPFAQIGSVRGSSSFTTNYLKTYIDGVELATPYLLFAIDPFSVERIEVIRGPQGSALYGSDAISGVVQVVTRKGTPGGDWRPRLAASLAGGMVESDFADRPSASQRHSAMLSSGGKMSSLGFGGTFEGRGALVAGGSSGYKGAYGGVRHVAGPLRVEGTMRYADVRFTAPSNPLLRNVVTASADLRPFLGNQQIEHETYGITADLQPHERWRHTVVVGMDRNAGAIAPQREQVTVADALLGATEERVSKASYRYSNTLDGELSPGMRATLTSGIEHSRLERQRLGVRAVLEGNGTGLASLYSDLVDNTGIFGQFKLALSDALYLSAGVRGERNNAFGEDFGTAFSPMLGGAWLHPIGPATLKLRAAYGKGIRPPPPSARRAIQTVHFRQLANPGLRPEEQSGIEGGVELYASDHASLSVTAYNQVAEGLIQQVVPDPLESAKTIQYQNVGQIENRGLEIEGSARLSSLRADVAFSLTDSRVRALSPTYTGDLTVDDRVPEVPISSGTASVSWQYRRTRATFGATYIGSWTGYDWLAYYGGTLGASAARPTLRSYFTGYPSLTKPYAALSMDLGRDISWMVRVDNLTNVQRNERDNLQISAGRTTMLGFRIGR